MRNAAVKSDNVEHARSYLRAIEAGATGSALAKFFAPDVIQIEYPNRLVPQGARRDLAAVLEGAERGQKIVTQQRFDVKSVVAQGEKLALEVVWTATFSVPIGSIVPGGEMKAHFGVFLEFRDGLILSQHNYDCFEPF